MTDLEVFLTCTTVALGALYIRSGVLLKKQRKTSHELVKNRDLLILEREKLINKLELESLKFQVSPHSLRNTLNVVKYYTETSNLAISRLTSVLDFLLYESAVDSISLKDELNFVRNFHELMKIRTTELVQTKFTDDITGNEIAQKIMVPPMITAYFLENAYKHGEIVKEAIIQVSLSLDKGEFIYVVENTIRSRAETLDSKGGIGLRNMKKRLDILYKDRYSLQTYTSGNLFHAELKIKV